MYVKELMKELKKYPSNALVSVRIDTSFWNQGDTWQNKISKKLKDEIDDTLIIPNYWIEEVEANTSSDWEQYPELTIWGSY